MRARYLLLLVPIAATLCLYGCGSKTESVDSTKPLTQSFASAEAGARVIVDAVISHLKSKNHAEAVRELAKLVSAHKLNAEQRDAVAAALKQATDAISTNPELNTKEMYDLRMRIFNRLYTSS